MLMPSHILAASFIALCQTQAVKLSKLQLPPSPLLVADNKMHSLLFISKSKSSLASLLQCLGRFTAVMNILCALKGKKYCTHFKTRDYQNTQPGQIFSPIIENDIIILSPQTILFISYSHLLPSRYHLLFRQTIREITSIYRSFSPCTYQHYILSIRSACHEFRKG